MRTEAECGGGLFAELRDAVPVERIREVLSEFGSLEGGDRSSARLRAVSGDAIDLGLAAHRAALLVWLRSWGCRHLRIADTARSSKALAAWWRRFAGMLPSARRSLVAMSRRELDAAGEAFGALSAAPAAWRALPAGGRASVSFGQTAAAKGLFAMRPLAFPPWDEPIRAALGLGGAAGYRAYLERSADALRGLAARLDVEVSSLPETLGRPTSTPPKVVDEYLWMRVNRPG